jgi:gamma-glutamylcyclotransferase (GGCT)/AIG2-like uncharacterized protein YtfP
MELKRAFVYGTLLHGLRNYVKCLADRVVKVEKAYVYGKIYHMRRYNCPALVDGDQKVWGEVLTFDDTGGATTRRMDELEEFTGDVNTSLYIRIPRIVYFPDHKELLEVYFFARLEELDRGQIILLKHGDWRLYAETGRVE